MYSSDETETREDERSFIAFDLTLFFTFLLFYISVSTNLVHLSLKSKLKKKKTGLRGYISFLHATLFAHDQVPG